MTDHVNTPAVPYFSAQPRVFLPNAFEESNHVLSPEVLENKTQISKQREK